MRLAPAMAGVGRCQEKFWQVSAGVKHVAGGGHADRQTHTHTHTHYAKEIKKPEPTVDSRQTGHLSKQLVRPQQKTV